MTLSKRLRQLLQRLWQRSQSGRRKRHAADARERFWASVREGERQAEADSS